MNWRLGERTRTVQTRASSEATSRICLISQCFIHPLTAPNLKEHTDSLWDIKWTPRTIVSNKNLLSLAQFSEIILQNDFRKICLLDDIRNLVFWKFHKRKCILRKYRKICLQLLKLTLRLKTMNAFVLKNSF